MHMSYWRFAAMIATSTVIMFGLMYLNTYALEHVLWSETRLWMALLMGATMAIIMLSYMLNMYQNKAANVGIYLGSIIVFGAALWLVRSQTTINQVDYMKAMIPHHSIAIMTSERAQMSDPRVSKLADEIAEAQRREISEMKYLVDVLEADESAAAPSSEQQAELVSAQAALQSTELKKTDPSTLAESEISRALSRGYDCEFSYTAESQPILAAASSDAGSQGVLKIHGKLVALSADANQLQRGGAFSSGPIHVDVSPLPGEEGETKDGQQRWPAHLVFHLDSGLEVGYRGWYSCRV